MYYVILTDCYGIDRQVEKFKSREEALKYIESLPDENYMVVLRNDKYALNTLKIFG